MEAPSADRENLGLGLKPGDSHYRAYVGPPEDYDLIAAMTFNLLTTLGLRQHHSLIDIGCGSLRIGRAQRSSFPIHRRPLSGRNSHSILPWLNQSLATADWI